jgi:hypothetical protein
MEPFIIVAGIILIIAVIAVIIFIVRHQDKKRTQALKEFADSQQFSFVKKGDGSLLSSLNKFNLFSKGHSRKIFNIMRGKHKDAEVTLMEYRYTVGGGRSSSTITQTVILYQSSGMQIPHFSLRPENMIDKVGSVLGFQDIDFNSHPEFSKKYLLRGRDEKAVRYTFNFSLLEYFEKKDKLHFEGNGDKLIYYKTGKRISPSDLKSFMDQGIELFNFFSK